VGGSSVGDSSGWQQWVAAVVLGYPFPHHEACDA